MLPSGWTLYVAADKTAFRARTSGPTGGEGLFMVGGWEGELSEGESLTLAGGDGTPVRNAVVGAAAPLVVGDSNGDGKFDQQDIVLVLQAEKYNRAEPATRAEGDWNGDGRFDQLDIVAALQAGTYMPGTLAAAADVVLAKITNRLANVDELKVDLEATAQDYSLEVI